MAIKNNRYELELNDPSLETHLDPADISEEDKESVMDDVVHEAAVLTSPHRVPERSGNLFDKSREDEYIDGLLEGIDDDFYYIPGPGEICSTIEDELQTVQDVVRYLVTLFSMNGIYVGHGTDNYWDEALELVQAVMFLQPPCDDSTLNSRLSKRERSLIAKMAYARTAYRIPTPYLTHRAFFAGHQFYVDRRVIVPRSPIAELIDNEFRPYLDKKPQRVLDMCTGSGCIAIAIALKAEGECEVDAVDLSADALEVAQRNIETYELENIVIPIQSDLFDNLPAGDKYDLIVANPPYVNAEDLESMPEEYHREPALALGSGDDGLNCVRRILAQARDFLNPDGILVVEVGNSEDNLIDVYPNVPFHFIDLQRGGSGVFVLTYDQLEVCAPYFQEQLKKLTD